ncbi:hypothetical protein DB032_13360 [Chromobacterium sp. Panama]|uniref:tyrosine-type recombinase/integrase n=1 Tax=Chromobacterium sp. Panama TaxID=2161826 RepID=UPI000D3248BA|nr:tyrosine-type recombinase/integrase [Chromobacterium sp. Panama]PTU65848.1 hypothetical protein DB032_13360 [Chromobacterium sp. Panama]
MNLFLSDSRFEVGGQPYKGFPILIDANGAVVEVALQFFVDELLGKAGARDEKTWESYGRHLYDYFGYLEAKGLRWDYIPGTMSGDVAPLAHYVRWCDKTVGNKPGYINDKVGLIRRFYLWAWREGLVDELPFQNIEVVSSHRDGMLSHTSGRAGKRQTTDLHMREADEPLVVLSRNQIDAALSAVSNPTHHVMLHLGLNAGLRAEEIITFPSRYVVDCSKLSAKVKSVAVYLNPRDMATKNDKPRIVRISVPCMNRLWQYREAVRPELEKVGDSKSPNLFLTRFGRPFAADGLVAPLSRLGKRLGFHIHPHMLRHTFATHTLAALEDLKRAKRLRGSPIVILMGLLGHSSVTMTSRYLHFLDAIDDAYGTRYQSEIDSLVLDYLEKQK